MQLIIFDNDIVAYHGDTQNISGLYPGCLVLSVPDGTPIEIGQPWAIDLDAARTSACAAIDAQAEGLRQTVLTPGAGQMAAYQAKEAQATALLQDPTPTEAEYPDIFNEIGVTADSAAEVAAAVLAAAEKWRDYGRLVERARLAGKKAVQEAADAAGIIAARDGVAWPLA
ncbi:hypothetical protein [Solidesulfovibrio alcoholivorans]|uniref:hypothetical protein n=1 Tax=Solidesulfovibrio alcoholivorans TaxID=81406 RepID=UPI0004954EF3|nr:hypothetical protein [Solidesulfovibrio alcoholivorans]